ncbi:flagellar assembly protein FliH [Bacillus sp. FSL K6-3431]|uniref:flagellar assembly protein FliH n=1 Tax=Bacillus sp. FSL K6-3431 TaxID=2921500 RepID=UPI0030FB4941
MSRIIKHGSSTINAKDSKLIKVKLVHVESDEENEELGNYQLDNERQTIMDDAKKEANNLIHQAEAQAKDIIALVNKQRNEWELEKGNLSALAYEEGFQTGVEEGKKSGFNEYAGLIEIANQVTNESKTAFAEHVQSAEGTILEIAIAAAEKILYTTLEEEKERFLPLVKRALKEAREFRDIQIHVHPVNYDLLISEKAELDALFPNDLKCFIYPDTELEEFACYIESDNGRIDASISSQLVELKKNLKSLIEGEPT